MKDYPEFEHGPFEVFDNIVSRVTDAKTAEAQMQTVIIDYAECFPQLDRDECFWRNLEEFGYHVLRELIPLYADGEFNFNPLCQFQPLFVLERTK